MDFIRPHLIKKIKEQVKYKQKILKHDGFFFFDKPIDDGKKIINRTTLVTPFYKEEVLPTSWYTLKGTSLLDMYSQLKDNNFYIYKLYEGKSHKMRIKKKR
jgi:hypothetical protein